MPEEILRILLDQNIPQTLSGWLKDRMPDWEIQHVNELGFQGKPDEFLYLWAQDKGAIIVTYDEDFADSRFYPLGYHHGIVRLVSMANYHRANPKRYGASNRRFIPTIVAQLPYYY